MSYKRVIALDVYASGKNLDGLLAGIGFKIGTTKEPNPNIEDTLIAAAIEGMAGDFRTLSLLTDWFEVHSSRVNVDRLTRAVSELANTRVKAYFSGVGHWLKKDPRYKKLAALYRGPRVLLGLTDEYSFLIKRNGEDERFQKSKLEVANGSLRRRLQDIATPEELVKMHDDYYHRILIGSTYRADMVALHKKSPKITASELARRTYGSFATAWEVMRDLSLLQKKS